jgi:hypothetical protein
MKRKRGNSWRATHLKLIEHSSEFPGDGKFYEIYDVLFPDSQFYRKKTFNSTVPQCHESDEPFTIAKKQLIQSCFLTVDAVVSNDNFSSCLKDQVFTFLFKSQKFSLEI